MHEPGPDGPQGRGVLDRARPARVARNGGAVHAQGSLCGGATGERRRRAALQAAVFQGIRGEAAARGLDVAAQAASGRLPCRPRSRTLVSEFEGLPRRRGDGEAHAGRDRRPGRGGQGNAVGDQVAQACLRVSMQRNQSTELIFELSHAGRRTHYLPECDVPAPHVKDLLPAAALSVDPPPLPEVGEIDLIRHFVNLSAKNMSIDTNFYPLGSCTMKYNPKRHERLAALPGFANLHPLQDDDTTQGMLELLFEMQQFLAEISGLPAVSLQPAAGAHGELTALYVAAAYFRDKGQTHRRKVLVPDSAHGTNPASAALAGFETVTVKSGADGLVDLNDLKAKLGDDTGVFMITNPNTLGLFEAQIRTITDLLHAAGALGYLDGANINAILGC